MLGLGLCYSTNSSLADGSVRSSQLRCTVEDSTAKTEELAEGRRDAPFYTSCSRGPHVPALLDPAFLCLTQEEKHKPISLSSPQSSEASINQPRGPTVSELSAPRLQLCMNSVKVPKT